MTKNPNKNQAQKQAKNVLDQQNEPCIRAIQKKLRNINKKMTEISELTSKANLKPEQIQKINKKEKVAQEKAKYEQFLAFYKEIVSENSEMYKSFQLKQLTNLAGAIALANYSKTHPQFQNDKISLLANTIASPSSLKLTLQQRVAELSEAFKSFGENYKLKQWVEKTIQTNSKDYLETIHKQVKKEQSTKKETQDIFDKKVEVLKIESLKIQKQEAKQPITPHNSVVSEGQSKIVKEDKCEEKAKQVQVVKQQQVEKPVVKQGEKTRQYRKYPAKNQKDYEKRKYKPKYVSNQQDKEGTNNKQEEGEQREDEDQQTAIVREFKREEVRRLHQDGFIVVGKPKVKAQGNDQKQNYQRQHGKQYHAHHHKQNY